MRIGMRTLLVLACLFVCTTTLEAQSFGELKRAIQKKYSPEGHNDRMTAAHALRNHVDSNVLRYAVSRVRHTSKTLTAVEADAKKLNTKVDQLTEKVAKARLAGPGNVNPKDVTEVDQGQAELKRLSLTVTHLQEFADALRQSIAKIVEAFPEADQGKALKTMQKAYKQSKDDNDKLATLRIIATCELPEVGEYLNKLVLSKKELDRLRAMIVAEKWGGKRAMRLALVCIEDPVWTVRAQSIRVLKTVGGQRAAGFIVDALGREDGRLKTDAIVALKYLTGENYRKNTHLWKKWLKENGHLLSEPTETQSAAAPEHVAEEGPRGRGGDPMAGTMTPRRRKKQEAGGGTGFYGIETTSKHVVYVLDFSGSMSATGWGRGRRPGTGGGGGRPPAAPQGPGDTGKIKLNGKRRIDRLANELLRSVNALPKDATFNVVTFTHKVTSWRDKMIFATKENKQALKSWIVKQGPNSSTNLFGGLEEAFKYAGRGSYDKEYEIAADTIFILSDGSPTAGRLQKPGEILAEMKKINSLRRIAIHGIAIGTGAGRLLQALARDHDGDFVQIPD